MDFFDLFTEANATVEAPEKPGQNTGEELCGCEKMSLAMAYIPDQKWGRLYEPQMGLERGTIFPDLDLPFMGGECGRK